MENVNIDQIDEFLDNNSSDLENNINENADEEEAKEGETPIDIEIKRVNKVMGIKQKERSFSFIKTLVSKKKRRYC